MVCEWGMSDRMGPLKYTEDHDSIMGQETVVAASAQTKRELDEEVRAIIDAQYERARHLIDEHRAGLEKIAQALLEYETLDAAQVKTLLAGGDLPPRTPTLRIEKPVEAPAVTPAPDIDGVPAMEPRLA
jgi:cell division protease FtsH